MGAINPRCVCEWLPPPPSTGRARGSEPGDGSARVLRLEILECTLGILPAEDELVRRGPARVEGGALEDGEQPWQYRHIYPRQGTGV